MTTHPMRRVPMLSVDEAARCLNVCSKTIRRLIERGDLPAHRIGRCLRIRDEAIRTYLNCHRG